MDIDFDQLPIPQWDILCPNCRYPVRGLPEHRCPECGTALDIRELIHTWTRVRLPTITGGTRPLPAVGVRCPRCARNIDGLNEANCPGCHLPITAESLRPVREWITAPTERLSSALVELEFQAVRLPYIPAQSSSPMDFFMGTPVGGRQLLIPAEFHLEALVVVRQLRQRLAAGAAHARHNWRCAKCGEEVPGSFEVCWNCGAARMANS